MKEVISILMDDHKKIDAVIADTKRLMTLSAEESFEKLAHNLLFFLDFTFKGHHKREEEVLYAWMGKQNPNADASLMNRIKHEHQHLETMGKKLHHSLVCYLDKNPDCTTVTVQSDLHDFIVIYLEHIEKEENFIFMIAEGLKLTSSEEAAMLTRMKATL